MRGIIKSVEVRYQATETGIHPILFVEFEDGQWGAATVQIMGGTVGRPMKKEDDPAYRNSEPLGRAVELVQEKVIQSLQDHTVEARQFIEQIQDWIANRKDKP